MRQREPEAKIKQEEAPVKHEATRENPWSLVEDTDDDEVQIVEKPSIFEAEQNAGSIQQEATRDDPQVIDDDAEEEHVEEQDEEQNEEANEEQSEEQQHEEESEERPDGEPKEEQEEEGVTQQSDAGERLRDSKGRFMKKV